MKGSWKVSLHRYVSKRWVIYLQSEDNHSDKAFNSWGLPPVNIIFIHIQDLYHATV